MATSGYVTSYVTKWDTLKFSWSRSSYSIDNNTSTISWKLELIATAYGYIDGGSRSWKVTVNGTSYSGTATIGINNNTTKTLASGTTTISHNVDGTKSFSYSFSQDINITFSGNWIGTVSGSGTGTLDTILRKSSVSATNGTIGNYSTITISRASSSFTHSLTYNFNNLYGNIVNKTSSTSIKWTLPDDFYKRIPNSKSATATIYCKTYSGSTLVGETSCTITVSVNESVCQPTLNPTVVDQGSVSTTLTGNVNKIIRYYNTVNVAFNASAKKSATIKSMKVVCGNSSRTSDGIMGYVNSGTFVFTITDSRGYTKSTTINKEIIDYIPLTCNLTVNPDLVDGQNANIYLTIHGNYFDGSFGAVSNSLTLEYRYRTPNGEYPTDDDGNEVWTSLTGTVSDGKYTANATINNVYYTDSYVFQARAKDAIYTGGISTAEQEVKLLPVFDWSENDFNFNVPVHGAGGFTYDIPVGAYNVNEMLTSGMYYLGSESTNRPINKNGWLEVSSYDGGNYCYQKFIVYTGEKYERWRNAGVWGNWITDCQNILWSGASHMNAGQTATLSSTISKQANGIQLIFSAYDTTNNKAYNYDYSTHTILKKSMEIFNYSKVGMDFILSAASFASVGHKYLTLYDGYIAGASYNTNSGTAASGITYNNSKWVLRYVIGF